MPKKNRRPAMTPEARENEMINLAFNLVEKRLSEGTATSQETTHFLKLGSAKAKLELAKLQKENILLDAKAEQIQSGQNVEELYKEAISAFREYSGQEVIVDDDEEY